MIKYLSRPGESPQYSMSDSDSYALTGNVNTFRQGVGAFRKARDLAKEQRNMFVAGANEVARTQSADTISFNNSNSQDTVTILREASVDSGLFAIL